MQDNSDSSYLDTDPTTVTVFTLLETKGTENAFLIEVDGTGTVTVDGHPTAAEWLTAKTAMEDQKDLGTDAKETARAYLEREYQREYQRSQFIDSVRWHLTSQTDLCAKTFLPWFRVSFSPDGHGVIWRALCQVTRLEERCPEVRHGVQDTRAEGDRLKMYRYVHAIWLSRSGTPFESLRHRRTASPDGEEMKLYLESLMVVWNADL